MTIQEQLNELNNEIIKRQDDQIINLKEQIALLKKQIEYLLK
jgi:hypothetical protein